MCFDFPYNFFSGTFLILTRIQRDIIDLRVKYPLFFLAFNATWIHQNTLTVMYGVITQKSIIWILIAT